MFAFLGNRYVIAVCAMLVVTILASEPAFAQTAASGSGPINWTGLSGLFTGSEGWVMQVAAIVCVFAFIAGLITLAVQGGIHAAGVALFGLCFVCVLVLAAPAIVSWLQGLISGNSVPITV